MKAIVDSVGGIVQSVAYEPETEEEKAQAEKEAKAKKPKEDAKR